MGWAMGQRERSETGAGRMWVGGAGSRSSPVALGHPRGLCPAQELAAKFQASNTVSITGFLDMIDIDQMAFPGVYPDKGACAALAKDYWNKEKNPDKIWPQDSGLVGIRNIPSSRD